MHTISLSLSCPLKSKFKKISPHKSSIDLLRMAISVPSPLSLGPYHCHSCLEDGIYCSTSYGITNKLNNSQLDSRMVPVYAGLRSTNPLFGMGSTQLQWMSIGRDLGLWKASVAADYSDSVPDSSNYFFNGGYHPLEDLKASKNIGDVQLTSAEIARTTVEAHRNALLIFPGPVHGEPHDSITWADVQYVIDDYGDIYVEILDDANILEDPAASNPVNALIGIDMPTYENRRMAGEYHIADSGSIDEIAFDDEYYEVAESEVSDFPFDWRMPHTSNSIHPIYFSKCLTKVIDMDYAQKMEHPSNGVSILGCLRPAFADEEIYIRRLFHYGDSDDDADEDRVGYHSEWTDGESSSHKSTSGRGNNYHSTLYRLEILKIELFSVYGVQYEIGLGNFQDAEPDLLVHSISTIVEHFREKGIKCDVALKALCKKKGLHVDGAKLIGVDSLGMDVRVSQGRGVQTHRFPFKVRATSELSAEKQIQQLLFPRSRRKKMRSNVGNNSVRNSAAF